MNPWKLFSILSASILFSLTLHYFKNIISDEKGTRSAIKVRSSIFSLILFCI
jgi:hypothetical protein